MSIFEDLAQPVKDCAHCGRACDSRTSDHCAECDAMFEMGKAAGRAEAFGEAEKEADARAVTYAETTARLTAASNENGAVIASMATDVLNAMAAWCEGRR